MKKINTKPQSKKTAGQVLVIFGISLLVLLFFVGLALDAGSVYVTYGQLKRAVDSAAIAAANEFKRGANTIAMTNTAKEVMSSMNIDVNSASLNLNLYICDENDNTVYINTGVLDFNPDGKRDPNLATVIPEFYARCPNTEGADPEAPKKLVWIEATQKAPLYFLSLLGFGGINLETNAISEAAPLDVVIVLDVSESMGKDTNPATTYNNFIEPNHAGDGCNLNNDCQPLYDAKEAAKALVDTLYDAVDQVSIVTYSNVAVVHPILNKAGFSVYMSDDMTQVKNVIDTIKLNDDAPAYKLWYDWQIYAGMGRQVVNLANPEDRDNDGLDADNDLVLYGEACPWPANPADDQFSVLADRFWTEGEGAPSSLFVSGADFEGWDGVPCDRDNYYDAYDWVDNGEGAWIWTLADHQAAIDYLAENDPAPADANFNATLAPLSTCIGCGIRTGADVLKGAGRYGSVWVMVFLTDGQANLSDTPDTNPDLFAGYSPFVFPNGFCNSTLGGPDGDFWAFNPACKDLTYSPRYCLDSNPLTCPPGSTHIGSLGDPDLYSVLDYARDMTDEAALKEPNNGPEPQGEDIAVYSVGLGNIGDVSTMLLRYMALIGIEGRRDTADPCLTVLGVPKPNETWCGQYYYATGGSDLTPIFEDIASRIFTRISE
jgi:hypothetical protein